MSFFGDNWREEGSFDLSEHDGFLNLPEGAFFNLLEDSKDKGDELSITNSEDKSPSNNHSPNVEDMNGIILQGTINDFKVNSMESDTTSRGEAELLQLEAGSHLFMPVDTHPEEEMKGDQYSKVPNYPLQSPTTIFPVMSPSEIQQHSRSAAKVSSFSGTSNTTAPSFAFPSSSLVPFVPAEDHSYNQYNRGISSLKSKPSTRPREKNGIDRIIEEHEKRTAEKVAAKKSNSTLLRYSGIQKKTPLKKGHRYSGSLDESLGRCQIGPSYNRRDVLGSLSPQKVCQVSVDGSRTHGSQYRGRVQQMQRGPPNLNPFQQMGQIQTNPPNLDYFEQLSDSKIYSYPQHYASSNIEQQAPFHRKSQTTAYHRFEHQETPMSTQPFQQPGQQMMNPSIERFHNQNVKREREASLHPNQWPVSHNQPLQSPQFMNPQEQYHSFQQTGHTQNSSSFSHINYPSVLDEPHSPLFPERNFWMPRANTNLHGQAYDQWQAPAVQEPQLGTQQHTNMSIGRSTTSFPSFPPTSFISERNNDQILEPLLDPPFLPSLPENTELTHGPKK